MQGFQKHKAVYEPDELAAAGDVKTRIHSKGGNPFTSTPAQYAADIDRMETKWATLIRKLGSKVE
jgi:hypothetical protein